MSPVKKIAIIGAGASGLTAIKQCADYGHEVKCFESTDDIGGLWRYREEDLDGIPSVAKSTISNTSKELSSFSDFPAPAEFPNFLPNQVLCKYFELYADRFDLRKYIRFNHKVLSLERSHDYSTTGQWKITYSHRDSVFEEIFDGVMVCSGHHVYPRIPEFPGQEKFQGLITHTHSYKKPEGFENKKVVVVGFANSALDAATELSTVADQVYLAVRTPGWVSTRTGFRGWPRDNITTSRAMTALAGTLGSWWSTLIQANLNSNFDQDLYGIKPRHQLHNQHPIISDHIAMCIISQRVKVRKNIKSFTRNGVIFEDDDQEVPVDVVVFGTGYEMKFPFISDPEIFSCVDDKIELYKNVFNANLEHPETLAYIGLVSPLGPIFPVVEMQSRWFAAIMKGEAKLPSTSEMKQAVKEFSETLWKTFYQSARNSLEVKFVPYMDEMAEAIGCKPDLYWTAIYDPKLWLALIFGPGCSYQYRLRGPHAWKGARDALINTSSRVTEGFKSSLEIRNLDKYDFSRNGTNGTNGTNGINGKNGTNGTNGINGKNGKIMMNSFIEHCEKPYKNGKKNIDMNDNDHVKSSDFMHAIS